MGNQGQRSSEFNTEKLGEALFDQISLDSKAAYYVAYSGGLDSSVLLHAMSSLQKDFSFELTALHVNHKLQKESDSWQQFCKQQCAELKINYLSTSVDVNTDSNKGLEAAARDARYDWFVQQLPNDTYLLTAHHQQDRAETLLLNLLRGAGCKGLSSLRAYRVFHHATLVRPLLAFSKQQLEGYAKKNKLTWIEDPSNQCNDFSRNYLRNKVIPELTEFRHDAVNKLARAAAILETESEILDDVAINDLQSVKVLPMHFIDRSLAICLSDIKHLNHARQQNLLRYWLSKNDLHTGSKNLLNKLLEYVNTPPSVTSILQESGWQFRYFQDYLYVMPVIESQTFNIEWNKPDESLTLEVLGIKLQAKAKLLDLVAKHATSTLMITNRQQGDVLVDASSGKTVQLKKWMQQQGIPPWRRFALPVLVLMKKEESQQTAFIEVIEQFAEQDLVKTKWVSCLPIT